MPNFENGLHDADRNSSPAQIADLVGDGKHVLGIGSGQDALWRLLREAGCTVAVSDLDATPLADVPDDERFDAVVCVDIGRLADPVSLLRGAAALLAPGGRVIISARNVAHGSIRLALLQGTWQPAPKAFLDPDHVHLYSRQGLLEVIESAGLQCDDLRAVVADPLDVDVPIDEGGLPSGIIEWVRNQPDALLSDFQVAASPVPAGTEAVHVKRVRPAANPDEVRRQDRHTDAAINAKRAELAMRDHVLGLQAEATAAQVFADYEATRIETLKGRLEKRDDEIDVLKSRISRLERRGFVGLLRRAKRKLVS